MLCTERHVRKGIELAQVSFDPAALFDASEINCEIYLDKYGTVEPRYNEVLGTMKIECMTFAPATIAPVINVNVKPNPNPNPNPKPNLNPYPTPNQKSNHYPHSKSLLSEISSPEQLSPEQMSDHLKITLLHVPVYIRFLIISG